MAGWMKKKRQGGNVQRLWEDKKPYGKGFHDKLFNEGVEEKEKDLEECGEVEDVDRIAQLVSPDAGGAIGDYEGEDDEDGETEITVKVEKEDCGGEKSDEDEDEMEEGAVGDVLQSVVELIQGLGAKSDPKGDDRAKELLAKLIQQAGGDPDKIKPDRVGGIKNLSMGEGVDEKDDEETDGEEMDEAKALADLPIIDKVLSALGETPVQGLMDLLMVAGSVMKGGAEKQKVKTLLEKLKAEAEARGNPLASEEKEEDEVVNEEEESEDEEDMDEAVGSALGGALQRIRDSLSAPASAAGKKKAKGEFKKVVGKTGIGTPAADKLALAGDEDEDEMEEAQSADKPMTKVEAQSEYLNGNKVQMVSWNPRDFVQRRDQDGAMLDQNGRDATPYQVEMLFGNVHNDKKWKIVQSADKLALAGDEDEDEMEEAQEKTQDDLAKEFEEKKKK